MNWDWISGFYEGEGCPTYVVGGTLKNPIKYLRISIVQGNLAVLSEIADFLEDYSPRIHRRKTQKKCWVLSINCSNAVRFARKILPRMHAPHKIKQLDDALRGRYHKA